MRCLQQGNALDLLLLPLVHAVAQRVLASMDIHTTLTCQVVPHYLPSCMLLPGAGLLRMMVCCC